MTKFFNCLPVIVHESIQINLKLIKLQLMSFEKFQMDKLLSYQENLVELV